ncbi:hypothetical protein [Bartonella sp. TT110JLCBS]|uniref:hypothetical protein n=1 Tax=Bartonella sp. TT110JLCBS TaxID=3243578 RepID=UPI0035D0970B
MPNFAVLVLLLSNLAYVAAEKTDGFWEDNLHIFDKTTSILMLREAGVFVTDKEGSSDIFRKKKISSQQNAPRSNNDIRSQHPPLLLLRNHRLHSKKD